MRDKRIICDRKKLYKSGEMLVTAGIFSAVIFGVSATNVSADSTNNTDVTVSQATDKVAGTTAATDKTADAATSTDKVASTAAATDKTADAATSTDKVASTAVATDKTADATTSTDKVAST
ncbi:KxYKxGKxW signal peptide domain-containing protein, partial [Enterococcus faecium]|nr:KxYKxGKxW signal peptide domain-containing protein [Enterococcus faecium]MDB7526561.1 KxYKxGKxW signal peptide domain-containing protein [Enterococcus faecium]MDB7529165.1 KxYKxGKxW signal peptide domain-containing protein [Enterococcus faecium]MDB7531795.1 KxYKxGKxW signal peptide domain-containing protein [Enterococcus faecium]MDB7534472.1 KxYKxGKxW signal peptide domain-containing protein [Enterococcus faecium]